MCNYMYLCIIYGIAFLLLAYSTNAFLFQRGAFIRKYSCKPTLIRATEVTQEVEEKVIQISEKARKHLESMRKDSKELYLRMGVRSGGCSGMSYVMDVIDSSAVTEEDHIERYDSINCVVDPKSLLYLYGLQLDYSDELIGGGFKFQNPNAETSW